MVNNDDEIRQLREQVRLLTERMFRIERQLGLDARIASPPAVPAVAPPPRIAVEPTKPWRRHAAAVWMAYGVLLIWVGFWKRSEFLRWQAIVLIGITILKVFIYDTSALQRGYHILAFMILGVILLAISFAYQKDWLGLQKSG